MFVASAFLGHDGKSLDLHCTSFNNLGPLAAIEPTTDIWLKHTQEYIPHECGKKKAERNIVSTSLK